MCVFECLQVYLPRLVKCIFTLLICVLSKLKPTFKYKPFTPVLLKHCNHELVYYNNVNSKENQ